VPAVASQVDFLLDLRAAVHAEHRRAADQQLQLGSVQRGKTAAQLLDGGRLGVEIGAWGPNRGHQQGAAPARDAQTPSSLRGALLGIRPSAMRTVSPVGSRSSSGLMALPAGVPSSDSDSLMPPRRPSAVKRWASRRG
jgi:hypothetical protein